MARTGLMLWHTVKKDVIKDIFPVVQNLGVLYHGNIGLMLWHTL
jgi:hypothetical protein